MLASPVDGVPEATGLVFEPKWDGFRCLAFRDGHDIVLQSRTGKPLTKYFPEAVDAMLATLPERVVLDGELVVDRRDAHGRSRLDWDALSERIHPASSRIRTLAEQTPARYVAFDLLALSDRTLLDEPFHTRRAALEELALAGERVHLTPATADHATAAQWFTLFEGAGLDGLIGKRASGPYTPGKRTMIKVKHARTADCVLAGLRWHAAGEPGTAVGSLLLGLYDEQAVLHHVGVVGAFPMSRRKALVAELAELREAAHERHPWLGEPAKDGRRLPGSVNRWRSSEQAWEPLRCERVLEVAYDHTEGTAPTRFRHTTQFVRWRPDRDPASCRYDQLDEPASYDLDSLFAGAT